MHLKFRNVNAAFAGLVRGIHDGSIRTTTTHSRNGEVLVIEEPVIVTYEYPRERVLFNRARDCNPFFHLYEALWMLAGRNDVAPLDYYLGGKYSQYSDDGLTANGAYGYRWRKAEAFHDKSETNDCPGVQQTDQLALLIRHLKAKPESRRAVLQMWNVEDDLLKIDTSKDVCCNLSALFSIEDAGSSDAPRYLNMTVFNRSNDLIWGMLGANVVHFSMLQEYVAAHLGVEVGVYNHVSNNLHVYTERYEPEEWLKEYSGRLLCPECAEALPAKSYVQKGVCEKCSVKSSFLVWKIDYTIDYPGVQCDGVARAGFFQGVNLIDSWPNLEENIQRFDADLSPFVNVNSKDPGLSDLSDLDWNDAWMRSVAQPMLNAFHYHKRRDYEQAESSALAVLATDWKRAAIAWIEKRRANYERKTNAGRSETD